MQKSEPGPGSEPAPSTRRHVPGTCPRCGKRVRKRRTSRPATWCSQKCRRAAYEERRAAKNGAVAVEVVEKVTEVEHDVDECVERVLADFHAMRRLIVRLDAQVAANDMPPYWGHLVEPIESLSHRLIYRDEEERWRRKVEFRRYFGANPQSGP